MSGNGGNYGYTQGLKLPYFAPGQAVYVSDRVFARMQIPELT